MPNLVDIAIDTAEAVGLYEPVSSSPNFKKLIRKLDPFQGHSLDYLRQFASEGALLEFKSDWVDNREEELRRHYGNFSYLTPMSNTFIVDRDINGKYVLCYANAESFKVGSYTIDSSYFYKSDMTKVVKPSYKDLSQKEAFIFADKFSQYLDFYDKVNKQPVIEGKGGSKWEYYTLEETHPSFPRVMPLVRSLKTKSPTENDVVIRLLHLYNDLKET